MATAVRYKNGVIEVKVPSADWGLESSTDKVPGLNDLPRGPFVESIEFVPGATTDKCAIFENSASGPQLAMFKPDPSTTLPGKQPLVKYFNRQLRPFIDFSEGSYSAGSSVIIIVE